MRAHQRPAITHFSQKTLKHFHLMIHSGYLMLTMYKSHGHVYVQCLFTSFLTK